MKKEEFCDKYGDRYGGIRAEEEARAILAKVIPMTLEAVKNGETHFFAANVVRLETPSPFGTHYHMYSEYCAFATDVLFCPGYYSGGKAIRGTHEPVPAALIRIFPELGDERFFVAEVEYWAARENEPFQPDPDVRWVCEFLGDNNICRWKLPAVADLSTRQIVALMELRSELDKEHDGHAEDLKIQGVEFGARLAWFEEEATEELIRRSLAHAEQATAWLADNFDKDSYVHVEWLRRVIENHDGLSQLCREFPQSKAVKFAETEPVTGDPAQWAYLPAIPAGRKEVHLSHARDNFYLLNGEEIPVQKVPGGGYFRVREDGRTDLFLKRGSRELGDKGWLWVLINPQNQTYEAVEAAIDPLNNYNALRGINGLYTPLFARIAQAHARARGWEVGRGELYSDDIMDGIHGPRAAEPVE